MCGGIARAEPEQAVAFDSLRHERQIVPLALELEAQFARYFYVLGLRNLRQLYHQYDSLLLLSLLLFSHQLLLKI